MYFQLTIVTKRYFANKFPNYEVVASSSMVVGICIKIIWIF